MFPSNLELINHIFEEVTFILDSTVNKDKNTVINDQILSRALIRSLEIIGEASAKLDPEFKLLHGEIEWRKMTETRNRLIHNYFGVDYDLVWDIINSKLPDLRAHIKIIIGDSQEIQ